MLVTEVRAAAGGHDHEIGLDQFAVDYRAGYSVASQRDLPRMPGHKAEPWLTSGLRPPDAFEGRPARLQAGHLLRELIRPGRYPPAFDQGLPHFGQILEQMMAHEVAEEVRQPVLHDATALPVLESALRRRPVALDEHDVVALAGQSHPTEQPDRTSPDHHRAHGRPPFATLSMC